MLGKGFSVLLFAQDVNASEVQRTALISFLIGDREFSFKRSILSGYYNNSEQQEKNNVKYYFQIIIVHKGILKIQL